MYSDFIDIAKQTTERVTPQMAVFSGIFVRHAITRILSLKNVHLKLNLIKY